MRISARLAHRLPAILHGGCFAALALGFSCLRSDSAESVPPATGLPALPAIDDASLLRLMPGAGTEYRLPERVYPTDLVEEMRKGGSSFAGYMYRSVPNDAPKWTSVPLDRWKELISDFAPVCIVGNSGNLNTLGNSPFTGKLSMGPEMSDEEFLKTPFQARERDTGHVIYAREEDMPPDYPARPNHTEWIPHLDGTTHPYRFHVPEAHRDAGPEAGSDRRHWFCPAGEVWRCRLDIIMRRVIPDLTAAVITKDDRQAVVSLAAVLDRLAEVYPELPLYAGAKGHGFARSRDGKGYLTADEYRAIAPEMPFIHARDRADYPFWYRDIYDFSYAKLNGGISAWTDGVISQLGWLAGAFDLIRDQPETRAWSEATYGDPEAWEKKFRERCLKEIEFLALATPPTTANTSHAYIGGAVRVGIACQNHLIFSKGLELIELYLFNNWSADGMAADAAFNYASMTQNGILGLSWLNTRFGGVDLAERYPLKRTIDRLGFQPISTLCGIVSKHGDQHALIFRGDGPGPNPSTRPYAEHEASLVLPFYGMTTLRGGAPGRRLELIVNHQNAPQHQHCDRLGYQLFYEGIDCLPDFGYCIGFIEPEKEPWSEIRTGYELMGLPNADTDRWGPWKWGYADKPEAHNVALVDDWYHQAVPVQLFAYAGAEAMASPGWWAQFVDAGAASLFSGRPNTVDIYRRQLALLTLPGGSPVVLDVLRIRGGRRHDLFSHVPAATPDNLPGDGEAVEAENWAAYRKQRTTYDSLTGKPIQHYGKAGRLITGLTRHPLPAEPWHSEWLIQPSRTFPQPESYFQNAGNWPELLHDVRLSRWSLATGSEARGELIHARGPWPGGLVTTDPKTGHVISAKLPTVGLKDAIDVSVQSREADAPGLESIFISALEARSPEQPAQLAEFAIDATEPLAAGGGAVCRLKLADGATGMYATTLDGETLATNGLALTGRMAALFPNDHRLTLVDGSHFHAQGWGLDLEPSGEMTLLAGVGDLTGNPAESALIVESERPLPTDGRLNGQMVYVWHRPAPHGQSVFPIAGVTHLVGNRWRIDLAGSPPFIQQRAKVLKVNPDDPRKLEQDFQFHLMMGQENITGRRIRFPRSGFDTRLAHTGRSEFTLVDTPPPGAVAKGDPFVVYSIQPGDRVRIPSRFACDGGADDAGTLRLDVQSTGSFELTVPMHLAAAAVEAAGRTTALKPVRQQDAGTRIKVEASQLAAGRGTLLLTRAAP